MIGPSKRVGCELRWSFVLFPVVVILFGSTFAGYLLLDWPDIPTDPAFFQHTGWYALNGGVPYVDVWDVNPPIVFGITAVLALLAGGDMFVLQLLSGTLMVGLNAASVLLLGWLAADLTDDHAAAVAAGFVLLLVPEFYLMPPYGTRAQFYALFFGLLALVLVQRDRPLAAGASAAISAGCWQAGAGFALLVVGLAAQRGGRRGALGSVVGGGVVTGLVILVFASMGAFVPMVVETILAPLIGGEPYTLRGRAYAVVHVFGYGIIALPAAFYGWGRAAVFDLRKHWWVLAGAFLFGMQVFAIDMDGSTDLVLWLAFIAIGIGIAVASIPPSPIRTIGGIKFRDRRWLVVAVLGLLVLSGLVWHFGSPPLESTVKAREEGSMPDVDPPMSREAIEVPSMQTIYWEKRTPETCHYRLSRNELRWIAITDDHLDATKCGRWPDEPEPSLL